MIFRAPGVFELSVPKLAIATAGVRTRPCFESGGGGGGVNAAACVSRRAIS